MLRNNAGLPISFKVLKVMCDFIQSISTEMCAINDFGIPQFNVLASGGIYSSDRSRILKIHLFLKDVQL